MQGLPGRRPDMREPELSQATRTTLYADGSLRGPLVDAAEAALRPVAVLDVPQLDRTFTLRNSEGFVENFGATLLMRVVVGFGAALALARGAELVATVPVRHSGCLREGLVTFALPFAVEEVTVAMMWHHRLEADGW